MLPLIVSLPFIGAAVIPLAARLRLRPAPTAGLVAAGAMAGVPLLNGFLSKGMFFGEALHLQWLGEASWHWLLPWAATLADIFAVAYSLRFIHDVFFGGEPQGLPNPLPTSRRTG